MDFIFFEDSWNNGKERHIQQRRTSTACKKENDTEESRGPEPVQKKT